MKNAPSATHVKVDQLIGYCEANHGHLLGRGIYSPLIRMERNTNEQPLRSESRWRP